MSSALANADVSPAFLNATVNDGAPKVYYINENVLQKDNFEEEDEGDAEDISVSNEKADTIAKDAPAKKIDDSEVDETSPELPSEEKEVSRSIFDVIFGNSDYPNNDSEDEEIAKNVLIDESKDGVFVGGGTIKVIDRTLGKLYLLEVQSGSKTYVNEMIIKLKKCWVSHDKSISSDSKALIEVHEVKGKNQVRKFSGWIFSKHPALSYMEHPKYDISLLKCAQNDKKPEAENKFDADAVEEGGAPALKESKK